MTKPTAAQTRRAIFSLSLSAAKPIPAFGRTSFSYCFDLDTTPCVLHCDRRNSAWSERDEGRFCVQYICNLPRRRFHGIYITYRCRELLHG